MCFNFFFTLIVPCRSGEYSANGKSDCFKCPVNFYQPSPGSGACLPCPDGYKTAGEGAVAEYECKLGVRSIIN